MYKVRTVQVKHTSELYEWCHQMSLYANNLYNAALFRERQVMCSRNKTEEELSDNEKEVLKEIEEALPKMKQKRTIPASGVLPYVFLDDLMKTRKNPDYYAYGFPVQTAQFVLKQVVHDIGSYFDSVRAYKANPSAFTGIPQFPHYKRKQGHTTFVLSNQDCVIRQNKKGNYVCKLPKTKVLVSLGKEVPGIFKEAHVTPMNGMYQMSFVFDDGKAVPNKTNIPERIIAVDPGVNNLMAVTNNCGLECLLYNGRPLKAINQKYNKQLATIMSETTKGSATKFVATSHSKRITQRRNNQIKDYMLKSAKHLVEWCVENRIDTIVLGKNAYWKQESKMDKTNNQNFIQIPHALLYTIIRYLAERNGIHVMIQEESYTSKASYLDRDDIPVYKKEEIEEYVFSGRRVKRGLYRSSTGRCINADLNGSANILRKWDENYLYIDPNFDHIHVIKHPDLEL